MSPPNDNPSVPNIPYFHPQHAHIPGTPFTPSASDPTLFTPLTIRGQTLKNRIIVAPMCQYSSAASSPQIGGLTPYHIATLGHYALKGAALVFIEASGVQPNGRISPNCPGIWSDAQIEGVKAVADFCHAQGALCGLQLAHAGRKGSTVAPFITSRFGRGKVSARAGVDVGGWPADVVGPSGGEEQTWDGKRSDDPSGGYWAPRELTVEEIQQLVKDFADAARRCVQAGVDVLEIHGAHGYLIHQFLSPITNKRTDSYGGSFTNRTRILLEIIHAIRAAIPSSTPLFLRLSATEWMETSSEAVAAGGSWDIDSTISLAQLAANAGVDLLDVSSGGNHPSQTLSAFGAVSGAPDREYQTSIAGRIRRALREKGVGLLIGAVGLITEAEQASGLVQSEAREARDLVRNSSECGGPAADVVLVARQFMREPEWVLKVAHALGVDIAWPSQFLRVRFPKL